MKNWSKKLLSALCVAALILGLVPLGVPALAAEKPTVWFVGDSTVSPFNDVTYFYPRYGYGTQFENYLDGTYEVKDLAVSGTSSKSFPTDGNSAANYEALKAGIQEGDVLIIGFGHNDEKTEEARYTDPNGNWETPGSFANSLWTNYVKVAQDAKAEAILCTPIVRRAKGATFSDSELHITKDSGDYKGGDYPAAIRKLGEDKGVAVVDLTNITKELYEDLGSEKTLYLHAWTSYKEGSVDNTHLNIYGAKVVAYQLAKAIQESGKTTLAQHIDLTTAGEPTQEKDLAVNPDYVYPPILEGGLSHSELWKDYTCYNVADDTELLTFWGSVFGDVGGTPSTDYFTLETDADGNMHMAATGKKGKFASGSDGLAMYFIQLPAGTQFKFSAKAKLLAMPASNETPSQGGFGLMARDDMFVDENLGTVHSDYVAAGATCDGKGSFKRLNDTLTRGDDVTLTVGETYDLAIESNPDGYAVTFNGVTKTAGFDFQLTSLDPDHIYIGMFVTRNTEAVFSDISLEITSQPEDPDTPDQPVDGMVAGGGLETLFAELKGVKDADITAVKYTDGTTEVALEGEDFQYLVRDGKDGARIDIPGVKAGTYDLTVTVAGQDYVAKGIQVEAHDRSGFAHQTVDENSACTPYTEGVGAYNDDGTLKGNAIVLYVTDENKDTVTLTHGNVTSTGIGNILNSKGQQTNGDKDRQKLLLNVSQAGIPIVVRILGTVTNPAGTTTPWSKENGGSTDDGGHMCIMQYVGNITIEGIGPDATVDGWGFSFSADGTGRTANGNKTDKLGENIEVRNLTFRNVPEDCIGINGSQSGTDFKDSAEHVWVHNNSFYGPSGLPDKSEDQDKSGGDGALDFRNGEYMTSSYNYFEGYHKTSLVGSGNDNLQYHITWHHNHWKGCEQRAPLARQADMHIYNNYFDGQTSYCMSLRANTYIFSEANTFSGCQNPMVDEKSGGVCKSYNDVFKDCTWNIKTDTQARGDNNIVTDKSQTVKSDNKFANFDTAPGSYVAKDAYKLDTAADALKNIETYGGVMKAAADMTTVPFSLASGSEPAEPTLTVTPETLTLVVGETGKLTADLTGSTETVTWTSSKPAVATVADDGTVTAVAAGEATITATAGTLTATATVTVTEKGEEPKPDCTELDAAINKAIDLYDHTQVSDKDGADINPAQMWTSSLHMMGFEVAIDDAIDVYYNAKTQAEVDEALEALNKAIADFEADRKKGTNSDAPILAETILLDPEELTLKVGASRKITATITPDNVTYKTVYWTTEDTNLITLSAETSQSGEAVTVTARAAGEATITVTADNVWYDIPVTITRASSSGGVSTTGQTTTPAKTETTTNDSGNTVTTESKSNGDKVVTVTDKSGEVVAKVEIPATAPELSYKFVDVPDEHWAAKAINEVAALGIVQGVSTEEHVFDMNSAITRAAMAQILFNLSQGKAGMENTFADSADAWYTDAIAWAASAGVVTGVSDTAFAPNDSITREQLATMLYRYAKLLDLDVSAKGDMTAFVDASAVDSWASEAMTWAVGAGLLQGKGNNDLDPTASATRAETATIMSRFLSLVK